MSAHRLYSAVRPSAPFYAAGSRCFRRCTSGDATSAPSPARGLQRTHTPNPALTAPVYSPMSDLEAPMYAQQHTQLGEGRVYQELRPVNQHNDDEWEETDDNGVVHTKTGVGASVFSYLCTCVGAGVLTLPSALRYSGWIGLLMMAIVAIACNHTAKYLCACMFSRPGVMLKTYEDIGEQALGIWGRRMVGFFQVITLFGVCTIFLILIGGNMTTLVPSLSLHDWIFIFAALLIPIAWLKTMNEVSVLALFGVLASLYVAAVVVIKGFARAAHPEEGADIEYQSCDPKGLSNALNIIVFSFGGHSVLPNIISHARAPQKNYARITTLAYVLIAFIYMITAAGGYAGWGRDTQDKILDNMDADQPVIKAAYAFITAHVVMAYPIPLNPLSLALESVLKIDQKTGAAELAARMVSRTCLVLLTVLVASVVPYFGDILSLVSALSIVVVVFVLPPWFYFVLFRHTRDFTLLEKATMVVLVVLGVLSSVIGIYYAVTGLVDDVKKNPNPFENYF